VVLADLALSSAKRLTSAAGRSSGRAVSSTAGAKVSNGIGNRLNTLFLKGEVDQLSVIRYKLSVIILMTFPNWI